jgi:hypothetical protein
MPTESHEQQSHAIPASSSMTSIPAVSAPSTGTWPNKKADYELKDAIGVGATATVYKVSYTF